jgi:hypothetical protein
VAFAAGLAAFFTAFFAAALLAAGAAFLVTAFAPARGALPAGVLEEFLRDFVDIRLPFVAFSGSLLDDI